MSNHEYMSPSATSNEEGPIKHVAVESSRRYLDEELMDKKAEYRRVGQAALEQDRGPETHRDKAKNTLKKLLIAAGVVVLVAGTLYLVGDKPDEIEKAYSDKGVEAIDGRKHMDQYYDAIEQAEAEATEGDTTATSESWDREEQN